MGEPRAWGPVGSLAGPGLGLGLPPPPRAVSFLGARELSLWVPSLSQPWPPPGPLVALWAGERRCGQG